MRCNLATVNDDQMLREKTAKLWAELNHAPILPEHINCEGCRVDGVKTVYCDRLCGIRQCALKKGVTTCGSCQDLETCQTIGMLISNNPAALENLKGWEGIYVASRYFNSYDFSYSGLLFLIRQECRNKQRHFQEEILLRC